MSFPNSNRTPTEEAVRWCSSKEVLLKIFPGKHLCWNLFFNKVADQHRSYVHIAKFLRTAFFYRTPLVAVSSTGVIQMKIWDLKIMLSFYKSNMTIMSFQRKRNVDIWCPRRFNIEIISNEPRFSDSKFQI